MPLGVEIMLEKEAENVRFIYNKDRGSLTLDAK